MKAEISKLWDTDRDIVTCEGSEFDRPQSFSDLKDYENVLVGGRIEGTKMREVLIGDRMVIVSPTTVQHPCGGTMHLLEVQ